MFLWLCKLFISETDSKNEKLIIRSQTNSEQTEKLANIRIPITYLCSNELCKISSDCIYYNMKTARKIMYICPGCTRMLCRS
jgi:hypothetical protein